MDFIRCLYRPIRYIYIYTWFTMVCKVIIICMFNRELYRFTGFTLIYKLFSWYGSISKSQTKNGPDHKSKACTPGKIVRRHPSEKHRNTGKMRSGDPNPWPFVEWGLGYQFFLDLGLFIWGSSMEDLARNHLENLEICWCHRLAMAAIHMCHPFLIHPVNMT